MFKPPSGSTTGKMGANNNRKAAAYPGAGAKMVSEHQIGLGSPHSLKGPTVLGTVPGQFNRGAHSRALQNQKRPHGK